MLKEASYKELEDRHEQNLAKLACIARHDIFYGGAKALTLIRRMQSLNLHPDDFCDVVDNVYHYDNSSEHTPYRCTLCDTVVLGETKAMNHCREDW
jgi:hypothetical protein